MIALLFAAAAPALACAPPENVDAVWADPSTTIAVFGEMHGTHEAPATFAEIACDAATRGPVVVGIEKPHWMQEPIDAFLASDGGEAAVDELVAGPVFDGREFGLSSVGILRLFERLRAIRAAGADLSVVAFVEFVELEDPLNQTPYESAYAARIAAAAEQRPDARVVVLVGNLHARTTKGPESFAVAENTEWMAMHLPAEQTATFDMRYAAGAAWLCRAADKCGPIDATGGPEYADPRIELAPLDGYDGIWAVGAITAAEPIGGDAQD